MDITDYNYDNYATWSRIFSQLGSVQEMYKKYIYLIKLNDGNIPNSQWKLDMKFESILTRMGIMDKPDFKVPKKYIRLDIKKLSKKNI